MFPAIKCITTNFVSIPYLRKKCDEVKKQKVEIENNKFSFQIDSNINMHDILILNSTGGDSNE